MTNQESPRAATLRFTVTDADTAAALGSGSLPVLGTPRLLAWCEAATCAALEPELTDGATSVGTTVSVEHRAPSRVGQQVAVTATLHAAAGSRRTFHVVARHVDAAGRDDEGATEVATGEIVRAVVDADKFVARL